MRYVGCEALILFNCYFKDLILSTATRIYFKHGLPIGIQDIKLKSVNNGVFIKQFEYI